VTGVGANPGSQSTDGTGHRATEDDSNVYLDTGGISGVISVDREGGGNGNAASSNSTSSGPRKRSRQRGDTPQVTDGTDEIATAGQQQRNGGGPGWRRDDRLVDV